jgi:hypothetical protein
MLGQSKKLLAQLAKLTFGTRDGLTLDRPEAV